MAVSKRVRTEIFRRDQQTCQYCGQMAPDVPITIDHVIPVALGGSDNPDNLVTACRDCNAGKTSISPDSPIVEKVSASAVSFAMGLHAAIAKRSDQISDELNALRVFFELWNHYVPEYRRSSWRLPDDIDSSVIRWHQMGVTRDVFEYAIRISTGKKDVVGQGKFAYTAGIIWKIVRDAETTATRTNEQELEISDRAAEAWDEGYAEAADWHQKREHALDFVACVVDGNPTDAFGFSEYWGSARCPKDPKQMAIGDPHPEFARGRAF